MSAGPMSDPNAIRNASLPKSLRGFDEAATRKLLDDVGGVVESLAAEREQLRRQVETLQTEVLQAQIGPVSGGDAESPEVLGNAILAAKRAGEQLVAAAQEEANQIVAAARGEADRLIEDARAFGADLRHELEQERERIQRERADHERAANEWAAKVETERESVLVGARAEAEAALAAGEQKLREIEREQDEVERLISETQAHFVSMLQAALAELEPLSDDGEGSRRRDLSGTLASRVGSRTRGRADHQAVEDASSS
jgi:cell division septum initiation protein DivIVA